MKLIEYTLYRGHSVLTKDGMWHIKPRWVVRKAEHYTTSDRKIQTIITVEDSDFLPTWVEGISCG